MNTKCYNPYKRSVFGLQRIQDILWLDTGKIMLLTNEERRVQTYTNNDTPTVPDQVTPEIPLDDLNLNWREDDPYLLNWYAPQTRRELLTYKHYIETGDYQYKELLKIILSRAARSARLTTHFDLDFPKEPQTEPYWCYKHSRTCYPVQEAFKFLSRYSKDTLRRIGAFAKKRTNANVSIYHADSRTIEFPEIDGIITSPPYVGLIDYHEQHKYAYHLLNLQDRRDEEIGPAAQGTSKKARAQYQMDIAQVFSNVLTLMPVGGRIIVVAGDRHDLYDKIARTIGVKSEGIVKRHVNRRTGRRSSEFYESIFIWTKI